MKETTPVGLRDLFEMTRRVLTPARGPVLGVVVASIVIETLLLASLPIQMYRAFSQTTPLAEWEQLAGSAGAIGFVVLGIVLAGLLRRAAVAPLRASVLEGARPGFGEVVARSLSRLLPVFAVRQIIGMFTFGTMMLCALLHADFALLPHFVVAATLAPAVYFTAARDMGVTESLGASIAAGRRHWVALFGVHALLVVLGQGLAQLLSASWPPGAAAGVSFTLAFTTFYAGYRFFEWMSTSVVFLAIDERM